MNFLSTKHVITVKLSHCEISKALTETKELFVKLLIVSQKNKKTVNILIKSWQIYCEDNVNPFLKIKNYYLKIFIKIRVDEKMYENI